MSYDFCESVNGSIFKDSSRVKISAEWPPGSIGDLKLSYIIVFYFSCCDLKKELKQKF